jgi:hypothetical protein
MMRQGPNADLCGQPGSRDPTVGLHDRLQCMRGIRLVKIWPVDARGR